MKRILPFITGGLFFAMTASAVVIPNPLGYDNFHELLFGLARAVGGLIAGLGTIMIIVAGILYLLSAGSPERIRTAKTALFYAIVGISIGLLAEGIVYLIENMLGA